MGIQVCGSCLQTFFKHFILLLFFSLIILQSILMNSFILVALCVVTCASFAFAQFSADCPPKTGDVYTIGSMDRISYRFNAALLAAEHAVNLNGLSTKPSVGCFDFNITLFTGGVASEELACFKDDFLGLPFNDLPFEWEDSLEYWADECDDLCFPKNIIRYDSDCKAANGAVAAEYIYGMASQNEGGLRAAIGCSCSGPSIEAANWLEEKGIPMVSPSATSARLSDVEEHPNFFRTCPGDSGQSKALVDVMQNFGIEKIAVIATRDAYSQGFADGIVDLAPESGIEVLTYQLVGEDTDMSNEAEVDRAMQEIYDSGTKVVVATTHCSNTRVIREKGQALGMTSENCYMWITGDGSTNELCMPKDDLVDFLGSVGTNPRGGSGDIYKDMMGFWAEQDRCMFPSRIHNEGEFETETFATEAYDAVLAVAMAIKKVREDGNEVTPGSIMAKLDEDDFSFQGATGIVSFGGNFYPPIGDHDRPPIYDLEAFEGDWRLVGYWSPIDIEVVNILNPIIFPTAKLSPPACLNGN